MSKLRPGTEIPAPLQDALQVCQQKLAAKAASDQDPEQAQQQLNRLLARPDCDRVLASSDFVAQGCLNAPDIFFPLLLSGDLDRTTEVTRLHQRITDWVANCDDEQQLHRALRRVRRREMLRIAWRDLSGMADLAETLAQISQLADTTIGIALSHHQAWLSDRYGQPVDADGNPAAMVVLGLGKLGGCELNFSSDVDLLFAYDHSGQTLGTQHNPGIDNQQFFIKLGQKLVTALDSVTADGFVFRTDMRLRPNGQSGPLVLSFSACEHYYQTHGRDWERYALIKARPVAGSQTAGAQFTRMLRPFVYRKYLDFGAFDSIREMKSMIQRQLRHKRLERDIKLGWGGIREVEFLVQTHQLIRGGRRRELQTSSLYRALERLLEMEVVDARGHAGLLQGYEFLRNCEHRLQMVADRQTQSLPQHDTDRIRLAFSMGFEDWPQFETALNRHRNAIHDQFKLIMDDDASDDNEDHSDVQAIWEGGLDEGTTVAVLARLGYEPGQNIADLLGQFRQGRLYQAFSALERDRVDRLMPRVIGLAATHGDSRRALTAFIAVLEGIGRRTAYLSLLIENPLALEQLLHLCAASPWISRHIGQHPVVLDELLHPLVDIRNLDQQALGEQLDDRLTQQDPDDEEGVMNIMREFHHAHVLKIAAADVSGVLDVDDIHRSLTHLAEVLLSHVFEQAVQYARRKVAVEDCEAGIIAYGKFASAELGYHSDLDIVVCYDNHGGHHDDTGQQVEYLFNRAGRRLVHLLTARTSAGILYPLDMRLRPSGKSGTLVTSLNGFMDYQHSQAWTWEHQALVRSRVVVGGPAFRKKFERGRRDILVRERAPGQLQTDILSMRRKMIAANCQSDDERYDLKLDQGGIVDIEFLIQYWVLLHTRAHPELVEPRTTSDVIAALGTLGVITDAQRATLSECYRTYLRRSLDLKLMDQPVLAAQSELTEQRAAITALWAQVFNPGE